jgi:hypothetical protein
MKTNEGDFAYEHGLDHAVEFFSKAGSMYATDKRRFYDNNEDILSLFQRAWITDSTIAFKLLLYVRDARGGAGNRSGFRKCLNWLGDNDPEWVKLNIKLIPEMGRFDDLRCLFGTKCEESVAMYWMGCILNGHVLAAKWAKRTDIPLYLEYKIVHPKANMGNFRRWLANIRKEHIVEHKMCEKRWNEVEYSKVPSVAMARYTNAFAKHDQDRFDAYKELLEKGETTVHAGVLFPHDCVRTAHNGDKTIADAQFDALSNYIDTDQRIITIADTSGSMGTEVSGSITACDVSQALALYCSAKMSVDSPFYKKFIAFCDEGNFVDWNGMKFSEAVDDYTIFDGAIGSTRIDKALDLILNTAKYFNLRENQMPTMLLICSDMQFSEGTVDRWYSDKFDAETQVEKSLKKWNQAGYTRPVIVYWNLVPYYGQPDTVNSKDIALVSGFSPSILKSVLACDDFSPKAIMLETLKKYDNIRIP